MYTVTIAETGWVVVLTSRLVSIVAWICEPLMATMGSVDCVGPRFQRTCEPPDGSDVGRKLLPLTVRVNDGLPAAAVFGEIEVMAGTGLPGGLMINVRVFDRPLFPVPEKGFSVLTEAVPGLAISAAATVAVTVTALT